VSGWAQGPAAALLGVALALVILALLLSSVRVVLGPSLPDRVVALDLALLLAVGVMNLYAQITHDEVFLDVAVVLALLAFLGTVAFASYLERGRQR
jgi:multicomponent Na+:H+ antiporter subunit F